MKETKKRRYIVSTIMYGMILIFIQLPWVVLKGKNYSIYAAYFRIKAKGIKALSEMAASFCYWKYYDNPDTVNTAYCISDRDCITYSDAVAA